MSPLASSRTINGLPQPQKGCDGTATDTLLITLVLFARTTHTQEFFVRPVRRDALKNRQPPLVKQSRLRMSKPKIS